MPRSSSVHDLLEHEMHRRLLAPSNPNNIAAPVPAPIAAANRKVSSDGDLNSNSFFKAAL